MFYKGDIIQLMTFYEVDMKIYQPEEVKYSPKPTAEVNITSEVDKSHVNLI